jgi:hypothetical protein
MSEPTSGDNSKHPWYEIGEWSSLEQGDFLPNCPTLSPPEDLADRIANISLGDSVEIPSIITFGHLIVMSQSCDLQQKSVDQVLLCAMFDASKFESNKDRRGDIRKGRRPALHMLEKLEGPTFKFEQQVVDFRKIYTLPLDFALRFAQNLGDRVRLQSPYKEHLSQAFARYFMRVGLPTTLSDD